VGCGPTDPPVRDLFFVFYSIFFLFGSTTLATGYSAGLLFFSRCRRIQEVFFFFPAILFYVSVHSWNVSAYGRQHLRHFFLFRVVWDWGVVQSICGLLFFPFTLTKSHSVFTASSPDSMGPPPFPAICLTYARDCHFFFSESVPPLLWVSGPCFPPLFLTEMSHIFRCSFPALLVFPKLFFSFSLVFFCYPSFLPLDHGFSSSTGGGAAICLSLHFFFPRFFPFFKLLFLSRFPLPTGIPLVSS